MCSSRELESGAQQEAKVRRILTIPGGGREQKEEGRREGGECTVKGGKYRDMWLQL